MIGNCRAKVTDFGMAKLLGADPRLTPTYCPGTNGYMSPEALAEPPAYTTKLDVFSCGVLFAQLITRKFPDPCPRTRTVELNDPRFPSGQVLVVVPELERRRDHLNSISPTHPLLQVALECLKDKEELRPTAEQLCSRLIALKESPVYQDSLQQTPEEQMVPTPPTRGEDLEQQLREGEERVGELTRQVQQLQLEMDDVMQRKDGEIEHLQQQLLRKDDVIQQKNEVIQQKVGDIEHLQQQLRAKDGQLQVKDRQLQVRGQESEQVVSALQQSVEQKDTALQAKDELLQEKKREIRELQQSLRGKGGGGGVATVPLKLEWRDGPRAPFPTHGASIAVSREVAYFREGVSNSKVLMYNSMTQKWTVLPECPKEYFSMAVVNGVLTAIGGESSGTATKSLLSLSQQKGGLLTQEKWIKQFPPMTYYHNSPVVATTNTSLIVTGGWGPDIEKATVEVMDTETLHWSTVASLPHPLYQATAAICGGRMYIGNGFKGNSEWTKSVLVCEVRDLQSATPQPAHAHSSHVWREIAELPVDWSSLITLQDQLLAIGGKSGDRATSEVRQYDVTTNSWRIISHMHTKRCHPLAAVLPNNRVMVVGGRGQDHTNKDHVEIASVVP